ncbi:MAG: hypothetical protein BGO34_16840 [Bacteroidia bacterium 44-10]|nr:MAG: hypothetical protein BGO34_16840 [Bacteroidia bacterium 44-10]
MFRLFFFMLILLSQVSCVSRNQDAVITFDLNTVVNDGYIGNGVQWDPYQLDYGRGRMEISESDWNKLYERLDFMRPQFIRMMINTSSFLDNGKFAPGKNMEVLEPMLAYCQRRGVKVMFGDWGWSVIDRRTAAINKKNMFHAAELLDYLVRERGFDCIEYYNLINEPNGDWSATNTSHTLWLAAMKEFYGHLKQFELHDKVKMVGPDIAIWSDREAWWIDSTAAELGEVVDLYDIHTYPSKITVNSGAYSEIIRAYKEKIPQGKKIVMGEIGFKFVEEADSLYHNENIRRAKAAAYASLEDSQMFVYDFMYGTDMADALFQTVNEGYSGCIVWMLDDAMHSNESPDKLKVWGFWNILGEEQFGASEEEVRPWFYAWSLLTKYMPAGSVIYRTDISGDTNIKAVISEKDGKQMIAVVNVSDKPLMVKLGSSGMAEIKDCRKFVYHETTLKKEGDHRLLPNEEGLPLNLHDGVMVEMLPESVVVFTNMQ